MGQKNPIPCSALDLLNFKQKVGEEDAQAIAMPIMIHLDCAKREACTAAGANFLTKHLIIASYIAARKQSQRFHDQVTKAYAALGKASARPTELLDLTTGEYKAIKLAIKTYLLALPNVEVGILNDASNATQELLNGEA